MPGDHSLSQLCYLKWGLEGHGCDAGAVKCCDSRLGAITLEDSLTLLGPVGGAKPKSKRP